MKKLGNASNDVRIGMHPSSQLSPLYGEKVDPLGFRPIPWFSPKIVEIFLTRPKDKFVHADPTRSIERRNYGSPPS